MCHYCRTIEDVLGGTSQFVAHFLGMVGTGQIQFQDTDPFGYFRSINILTISPPLARNDPTMFLHYSVVAWLQSWTSPHLCHKLPLHSRSHCGRQHELKRKTVFAHLASFFVAQHANMNCKTAQSRCAC